MKSPKKKAQPKKPRVWWIVEDKDGLVYYWHKTLKDAKEYVKWCDRNFPRYAPHRVVKVQEVLE